MGIGDDLTINKFKFCKDHGHEVCWTHCFCDHREDNNSTIPTLAGTLNKGEKFNVDERKQIDVFALGAVPGKKAAYKCKTHGKDECKKCFDWAAVIARQEQ